MIPIIRVRVRSIMAVRPVMLVETVCVRLIRWIVLCRAPVDIPRVVRHIIHVNLMQVMSVIKTVPRRVRVKSRVPVVIVARIIPVIHIQVPSIMGCRVVPVVYVRSHQRHVILLVHRSRTPHQRKQAVSHVLLQTVQGRVHIPIPVVVIIPVRVVRQRGNRVQVVQHMAHVPVQAHVMLFRVTQGTARIVRVLPVLRTVIHVRRVNTWMVRHVQHVQPVITAQGEHGHIMVVFKDVRGVRLAMVRRHLALMLHLTAF